MDALLQAEGLMAGYGSQAVVRDLNLEVRAGEMVVLLGPNGAGKSTTLMTLSGALPGLGGRVSINGRNTRAPAHKRARMGMAFVPDQRAIFRKLSTRDNLRLGRGDVASALEMFPELVPRLGTRAGLLSGGEQQMLALCRALSRKPSILLVDELSLGLAPLIVERLLRTIRKQADDGLAVLLVEQHVRAILGVADRAYVMRRGSIVLSGASSEIQNRLHDVEDAYLSQDTVHRDSDLSTQEVRGPAESQPHDGHGPARHGGD
jgi:ABC-type branched-subunit amino acid transport system ATPase component